MSVQTEGDAAGVNRVRLWTRNFALLWQGQLVSSVGDVVYEIALGFWVLAVTGSTALMGTLMAATMLPRVILGPFAGTLVDRSDRKWLMVTMDAVRGVAVVAVGAAAALGVLQIWMVFAAGVLIGICASIFNPSIYSSIPDIVHRERVVQGNSFFQMIRAGSGILGNGLGGALFAILGAPVMFLVNGVSYLFSALTELFVRIPRVDHGAGERKSFMHDLAEGMRYVWHTRGLRFLMVTAGVVNFFAMIGIVLILPLFQRSAALGPAGYGIAMAVMTGGMLAGMAVTAALNIPAPKRTLAFSIGVCLFVPAFALFPQFSSLVPMLLLIGIAGFFNAVVNVILNATLQITVPARLRGKVMGLLDTITQGLTPVGMAVGGLLGEYLPLPMVISGAFVIIALFAIPGLFLKEVRMFFAQEGPVEVDTQDHTSERSAVGQRHPDSSTRPAGAKSA
ncbi:MFS transporter [Salinispira pacifica]